MVCRMSSSSPAQEMHRTASTDIVWSEGALSACGDIQRSQASNERAMPRHSGDAPSGAHVENKRPQPVLFLVTRELHCLSLHPNSSAEGEGPCLEQRPLERSRAGPTSRTLSLTGHWDWEGLEVLWRLDGTLPNCSPLHCHSPRARAGRSLRARAARWQAATPWLSAAVGAAAGSGDAWPRRPPQAPGSAGASGRARRTDGSASTAPRPCNPWSS